MMAWLAPFDPPDLRLSKTESFRKACYALAQGRRISPPPQVEPRVPPWGVQLAFGSTKVQAQTRYAAKTRACRKLVSGEDPTYLLVKNRVSGRKGYYMARIGRNTRAKAVSLCKQLSAAGCSCRVYRND